MTKTNFKLSNIYDFLFWPSVALIKVTSNHMHIIGKCLEIIKAVFGAQISCGKINSISAAVNFLTWSNLCIKYVEFFPAQEAS
jgi:hypothetical protein